MELNSKVVAFLGDSITEGVGASCLDNAYWRVFERLTGSKCFGFGISGTRIAPNKIPSPIESFDRHFSSRVEELPQNADVIIVFGGTNDFGHGDAPFGQLCDTIETTFCGAYHGLMQKLINKFPDAQIVVMTPLHRSSENELGFNEWGVRRDHTLEDYVDAIISIAGFYGIPVLDLFRTSGIQPRIPVIQEKYMPDGLHPSDAGHAKIAKRLAGFLQAL